jgi:hypothetical protein
MGAPKATAAEIYTNHANSSHYLAVQRVIRSCSAYVIEIKILNESHD